MSYENSKRSDPLAEVTGRESFDSDHPALPDIPSDTDRRTFLMRSALIGATAIMIDRPVSAQ